MAAPADPACLIMGPSNPPRRGFPDLDACFSSCLTSCLTAARAFCLMFCFFPLFLFGVLVVKQPGERSQLSLAEARDLISL